MLSYVRQESTQYEYMTAFDGWIGFCIILCDQREYSSVFETRRGRLDMCTHNVRKIDFPRRRSLFGLPCMLFRRVIDWSCQIGSVVARVNAAFDVRARPWQSRAPRRPSRARSCNHYDLPRTIDHFHCIKQGASERSLCPVNVAVACAECHKCRTGIALWLVGRR